MSPLLIVDRNRLQALGHVRRMHAILLLAAGALGGYWASAHDPAVALVPSASAATPAVATTITPQPWCQDKVTTLRMSCGLTAADKTGS